MDLTCSYSNALAPWLLPSRVIKCKISVDLLLFSWLQSYSCRNLWMLLDLSISSLHVFSIILFQQLSNEKKLVDWVFEGITLPSSVGIIISHSSDPYETTTMLWQSLMSGYPVIPIWKNMNNISQLWIQTPSSLRINGFQPPQHDLLDDSLRIFWKVCTRKADLMHSTCLGLLWFLCFSVVVGMLLI